MNNSEGQDQLFTGPGRGSLRTSLRKPERTRPSCPSPVAGSSQRRLADRRQIRKFSIRGTPGTGGSEQSPTPAQPTGAEEDGLAPLSRRSTKERLRISGFAGDGRWVRDGRGDWG